MDFAPSTEQRALCDTARAFLADRFPLDRIADWAEPGTDEPVADEAGDALAWKEIGELGWLDPELGVVELVLLAEQTGYGLYPGPWLTTVGLAAPAYLAAGRGRPAGPTGLAWSEPAPGPGRLTDRGLTLRAGPGSTVRLSGRKTLVPDGSRVAELVVTAESGAGICLYTVDPADAAITVVSTVDSTRPLVEVEFAGVPATLLVGPDDTAATLERIRLRALALLAAEAVGVAQRSLHIATGHARTRHQFGRAIGGNQGLSHRLVDVYADIELARSLAYRAGWCVATGDPGAGTAVVTATIAARRAALGAGEAAIQTLGALGFSWEHPAHRWYRRARWIAAFEGSATYWRARLADLILAELDGADR